MSNHKIIISSSKSLNPTKPTAKEADTSLPNQCNINWDYLDRKQSESDREVQDILITDSILDQFETVLKNIDPNFSKVWQEQGPRSLLELRISEIGETLLHYACQQDNVVLVNILVNYRLFTNLINFKECKGDKVSEEEFRKFVYARTTQGEYALEQCLKRLEPRCVNKALNDIIKLFIQSDLIYCINMYLNNQPGYKTTILHLLIEREQFKLLKFVCDIWEYNDYDEDEQIDFEKRDFLERTPLQVALSTGNQKLANIIYKKNKRRTKNPIEKRSIDYLQILNIKCNDENDTNDKAGTKKEEKETEREIEKNNLQKVILQNKLTIVSIKQYNKDRNSLKICDNQYIFEVSGRTFETIWIDYLRLVNEFGIVMAECDHDSPHTLDIVNDFRKQIVINRVNAKISDTFTLVTLVLLNYTGFYKQLCDFVRFLPFNFKIVLPVKKYPEFEFSFFVKRADIFDKEQQQPTFEEILSQHVQNEQVRNGTIFENGRIGIQNIFLNAANDDADTDNDDSKNKLVKFKFFDSVTLVRTVNEGFVDFAQSIKQDILKYQTTADLLYDQAFAKFLLGVAYSEYSDQDMKKQAMEAYADSIKMFRDFYKEDSSCIIARALNNIGLVHEDLGEFREALVYYKKALDMFEKIYKRDHLDIYMVLSNIGSCYSVIECKKEATKIRIIIRLEYMQLAHEMQVRLNNGYAGYADYADYNLGIVLGDCGRPKEALDYLTRAIKKIAKKLKISFFQNLPSKF